MFHFSLTPEIGRIPQGSTDSTVRGRQIKNRDVVNLLRLQTQSPFDGTGALGKP